jgi:hypothetical protein
LAKDGEKMRRCLPDSRWFNDLGRYYVNDNDNVRAAQHCDMPDLARKSQTE